MKRIRILHVVGGMNRGGAETFLMNVLRHIDRKRFYFIFLCYGDKPFDYEDEILSLGGEVVRIPDIKSVGPIVYLKNIRRIIKEEKIDIIHTHTYYNSVFALIVAKISGIKLRILHSHSVVSELNPSITKRAYFILAKLISNICANSFIACTDDAAKSIFLQSKPYLLIRNAIDINSFKYSKIIRANKRRDLRLDNSFVVGHAGRFEDIKNHDFVIEVFNALKSRLKKSKLILVGTGINEAKIREKVEKYKLSDNVLFLGSRSDVSDIMQAMDAFILPSVHEGLGIVLIEAQASGLQCYASTGVPKAAKVTDKLTFLNLREGAEYWAEHILKHRKAVSRRSTTETAEDIAAAGYDIDQEVIQLSRYYTERLTT